ncbi:MAG: hypothetical protein KBB72_07905 [Candidatus Kapabacteria bacterium]|nr:hypothetical protein [Candidatus Kapabacteria bacterium]
MIVMKFGGAVLREPDGFRRMVRILQAQPGHGTLVVVSAFATATRDLEFASRLAQKGLAAEARERLDQVVADHRTLLRALLPSATTREGMEALLDEARTALTAVLDGVSTTRQLTPKTLDRILAYGEFFALHIARHVLQEAELDVVGVDAQTVIVTTADHGTASPLPEKTAIRVQHELLPALSNHRIVLVQGFVGRTEEGATTTMGKESSNLTATLLGSLLEAQEVVIFTDVEGIRSADPHTTENTSIRPHLTYDQARVAAHHGLKLLYPTMIDPAAVSGLPIRIASAEHPNGESTIIDGAPGQCLPIVIADHAGSDVEITTVFIDCPQWLPAVTSVVLELHSDTPCDVHTSHADRTAVLRVPAHVATDVVRRLHLQLSSQDPKS